MTTSSHGTVQHPRYRLDSLIAVGGMGEVWSATDTLLEREVAVKVLKREHADDPVFRARFAAEARHAAALSHPHVAAVLDYGELPREDGDETSLQPFLVMERVPGQPLSALLADQQPLDPEVAADLIAQAADGVEAAHRLGIVHRDVKPGNLLVTTDGQVKVTDFGIARAADALPLTVTGHLVGTPHYLSPEQAEGKGSSPASDVYALGIVLFECLTGHKPFIGESPVATALMQVRDPLPTFPDSVPVRLQEIARRATAKAPEDRYASAADMAAALRGAEGEPRTSVLPPPEAAALAEPPTLVGAPAAGGDRSSRRPLALAGLAVLALIAVAVAAGALIGGSDGGSDAGRTPTAASTTPSPSTSPASDAVRVDPAAYVGMKAPDAEKQLREAGLQPVTEMRTNTGDAPEGTVAAVSPTGMLDPGTQVTLAVWDKPAPAPKPDKGHGPDHGKGKGHDKGKGGKG